MDGALALVSYVRFWGYSVEKPPLRLEEVIKLLTFGNNCVASDYCHNQNSP